MQSITPNPLAKHFRQPKVYIRLPSGGEYYEGGIVKTENGEYPVLGMTAKDELIYKTPDALINGQATVEVIQSCVPNIKNAWNIPSIDLDAILIGIRIATYGEKLDLTMTVPGINEERSYEVDLKILLDQLYSQTFENTISVGEFVIEIRPTSYKYFTDIALKTFEEQRIFKMLRDDSVSQEEKIKRVQESFNKLTDINIDLIKNSIVSIQYLSEPVVTNRAHINEFINNADKDFYYAVIKHIEKQKEKFTIKPLKLVFSEEDQKLGAPAEFDLPITLDQSNFFGKGS
jgi:hypothetical protein